MQAEITGIAVDSALEGVSQTLLDVICKGCLEITQKSNVLMYVQKDSLGELNFAGTSLDNVTGLSGNRIKIGDSYVDITFPEYMVNDPARNYSTIHFSVSWHLLTLQP